MQSSFSPPSYAHQTAHHALPLDKGTHEVLPSNSPFMHINTQRRCHAPCPISISIPSVTRQPKSINLIHILEDRQSRGLCLGRLWSIPSFRRECRLSGCSFRSPGRCGRVRGYGGIVSVRGRGVVFLRRRVDSESHLCHSGRNGWFPGSLSTVVVREHVTHSANSIARAFLDSIEFWQVVVSGSAIRSSSGTVSWKAFRPPQTGPTLAGLPLSTGKNAPQP